MKNCKLQGWLAICALVLLALPALAATIVEPSADSVGKNYSGLITQIDPPASLLTVKGVISNRKFHLSPDCLYVLLDNRTGTVKDLRPGQKVKVDYQETNGLLVADRVELQPQIFEGQVTAMDITNHTFTVSVHWLDKVFQIPSNCVIALSNDKSGTWAAVQMGEPVTVTYETPNGVPTACRIAQKGASYTGTLTAIDLPNRTIQTKTFFGTKKFNVADNCAIIVNGKTEGQLSDLKLNDRLAFIYEKTNGVNIANRIAPAPVTGATNNVSSTYVTQPGTGY